MSVITSISRKICDKIAIVIGHFTKVSCYLAVLRIKRGKRKIYLKPNSMDVVLNTSMSSWVGGFHSQSLQVLKFLGKVFLCKLRIIILDSACMLLVLGIDIDFNRYFFCVSVCLLPPRTTQTFNYCTKVLSYLG
jgi:hypothetical protein